MTTPKLSVDSGPGAGLSVELEADLVVGREGADLTIEDAELSRRHVVIRPVDGGVEIEDLGSTNGTFVDGRRIKGPARVTASSKISVGQSSLSVELPLDELAVTARRAVPAAGPTDVTRERDTAKPAPPKPAARRRAPRPPAKAPATEEVAPAPDGDLEEAAPRKRSGPPLFEERTDASKLLFVAIGPAMAGVGSAVLLGISAPLFALSAVAGLSASFMGGREHRDIGHGALRGLAGGFFFAATLVLVHKLIGTDAKAELPEPLGVFVAFATFASMAIGAGGALVRSGQDRPRVHDGRDLRFFEFALAATLVSAPMGAFSQILHPLPEPGDDNPRAFLETIAPTGEWVYIHLLAVLSFLLLFVPFLALWRAQPPGRARWLAGLAVGMSFAGMTIAIIWMMLDGVAIKDIGDAWAAASGDRKQTLEEIAISLEEFILALFSVEQIVYFGLPFVLLGLASLQGGNEPAWFGWSGVVAGCWNCTVGVAQTFTDRTELWTHILLPIGVVYVSVWLPTAVFFMWRRVASGPPMPPDPEVAAPPAAAGKPA